MLPIILIFVVHFQQNTFGFIHMPPTSIRNKDVALRARVNTLSETPPSFYLPNELNTTTLNYTIHVGKIKILENVLYNTHSEDISYDSNMNALIKKKISLKTMEIRVFRKLEKYTHVQGFYSDTEPAVLRFEKIDLEFSGIQTEHPVSDMNCKCSIQNMKVVAVGPQINEAMNQKEKDEVNVGITKKMEKTLCEAFKARHRYTEVVQRLSAYSDVDVGRGLTISNKVTAPVVYTNGGFIIDLCGHTVVNGKIHRIEDMNNEIYRECPADISSEVIVGISRQYLKSYFEQVIAKKVTGFSEEDAKRYLSEKSNYYWQKLEQVAKKFAKVNGTLSYFIGPKKSPSFSCPANKCQAEIETLVQIIYTPHDKTTKLEVVNIHTNITVGFDLDVKIATKKRPNDILIGNYFNVYSKNVKVEITGIAHHAFKTQQFKSGEDQPNDLSKEEFQREVIQVILEAMVKEGAYVAYPLHMEMKAQVRKLNLLSSDMLCIYANYDGNSKINPIVMLEAIKQKQ